MALGVDYSAEFPPLPGLLRGQHIKFVCRYVSTPGNKKNLALGEALGLRAAGIAVVLVFEVEAGRALKGYSQGAADAASARQQSLALGLPEAPIYFAVDFDALAGQQSKINAYLQAASKVLGHDKTGVYGGYWVVKRALDAGVCKYAWQTYAWSGGRWDKRAHIQQYQNGVTVAGVSCDLNRSTKRDYGQTPKPRPIIPVAVRRAHLRAWVLAQRAEGATWAALKRTARWNLWRRLGGK